MKDENYKGYTYPETEEMFITDDRNVNDKQTKDDLKSSLDKIFKQLDEKQGSLKIVNRQIRELVGIYENEDESEDVEVIELVKNKNKLLADMKDLKDVANTIIKTVGDAPKSIKTNFFINKFGDNSQKSTDYINDKLSGENILSGTIELFQGLGFTSEMGSGSSLNLYYTQYKMLKIFGIECELL